MNDPEREALEFLYGRLDYERLGMPGRPLADELGLGRMRRLLRRLGDPQDALSIVHVAGTKGKGSTSAMVAAALVAAGVRTGLFTSPHLHRLEERFVVDGAMMTSADLVDLVDLVRPEVAAIEREALGPSGRALTFFEITTAIGLLHFARLGCRALALEVGMGGRLDSTNVVRPAVSVITTISFDHVRQLGPTLGQIAREKAGILKRGRPSVLGVRGAEPLAAIREIAQARHCPVRRIDEDFRAFYEPPKAVERPGRGYVSVRTWRRDWGTLPAPLPGAHQADNAAVALAALDALAEAEPSLEVAPIDAARGFEDLRWPARVEVVGRDPLIVIDGAHNAASALALAETLRTCFPDVPRTLVFGTSREKDLGGQLRALLPLFGAAVATRYIDNPRAVDQDEIGRAILDAGGPAPLIAPEPATALAEARRITPPDGLICVTGSLFLAAEARATVLGIGHVTAAPRLIT